MSDPMWRRALLSLALGILGFLCALWSYDLYLDHRFLHEARIANERAARR